jgi:hypothetical protein
MFPGDQKMLTDPNVWIADTVAMVHMTPYAMGMHKIKEATANNAIRTIGNGTNEKALQMASVTGMRCDKHGNEFGVSKLTEVTHLPNGFFLILPLQDTNEW